MPTCRLTQRTVTWVTLELHVDDLERHGPGLVVDHTYQGRQRALVWLE